MLRFARTLAIMLMLGVVALLATGCGGGGQQPVQQMTADDRAKLAPRDDFEAGKDKPITADTHFAAGQFAESQGNTTQAMAQYKLALRLNPKHKDTLFRVAVIYVKQRKFAEAIECWNKYIAATDGDATAYANLGFAYELAGQTTEAEVAYTKGIRKEPSNSTCRVNYGLMLARKERFNEALLQLQTVLSDGDVHYNLASVYESLGRREQAKVEYQKALKSEPNLKEAQARLDALQ